MKSISGKVISSKPISHSKAAETVANFASSDNGASLTVSAYLKRAAAEFTKLAHFHKQLKSSHSCRKRQKHQSTTKFSVHPVKTEHNPVVIEQRHQESDGRRRKYRLAELNRENPSTSGHNPRDGGLESVGVSRKQKRNWSKNAIDESRNGECPNMIGERDLTNVEDSVRKREKERKKGEVEQREGGGSLGNEKKRKIREFIDKELLDSGEQRGMKKKKRKVAVEG